ncbi:uncharacterized protein LOC115068230 [Nannospalax galili]|uniref:uncharacterized protein LOC115068230 n=1 Tax=Nannospalax galili TaxID=1026970 RepID=UPI00111C6F36|nr:uncharacterized protein LOC115068230 [Nannospalax galili]
MAGSAVAALALGSDDRGGGGGGEEASPAKGGRREERRALEEGLRGRGEGKQAAWEGKGRRHGAGDPARRETGDGRRGGPRPRSLSSLLFLISPGLAFPLFSLGSWSPRRCVTTSLVGAGGEATAKLSANFTAWLDLGCCKAQPVEGGGVRLTQVARLGQPAAPPSRLFCQLPAAKRPLLPCLGRPPSPSLHLCDPWHGMCSTSASWGPASRNLGQKRSTGCPRRSSSLPPTGLLADSEEPNGNFIKVKTNQFFRVMQRARWQYRALD